MQRLTYVLVFLAILSASVGADYTSLFAQTNIAPNANALLQEYNVSNSLISSMTYANINYSGHSYLLAYSGKTPEFLINSTGGVYSIILNSTNIAAIINNHIINTSLYSINTTYLESSMNSYNQSSSSALTACIEETGLDRATCTFANNCESCTQVPACGGAPRKNFQSAFYATGGIYGILAYGIMLLQSQYASLESNFSIYFSGVNSLKGGNPEGLNSVVSGFGNVSNITSTIYQNPLFPPLQTADFGLCSSGGAGTSNVPSANGPWYCSSLGFCPSLSYNYTLLGNMQSYISSVSSLPLTSQQVGQIAVNITTNEDVYVLPVLTKEKHAQALAIANSVLPDYNMTTAGAALLLSHISNSMLQNQLSALQSNYTKLTRNYVVYNLSSLNKSLAIQYSQFKTTYYNLNSTYSTAVSLAANNTVALVELQSGNPSPSQQLTALSFRQASLNYILGSKTNNISSVYNQLVSVSQSAKSLSFTPSLTQSGARLLGAPIASAIVSAMGLPYSTALAYMPALSLVPAIIVAIVVLVALFMLHRSMVSNKRIMLNRRTRRNWHIVFILAGVVALIFLAATYATASAANGEAPISSFIAAVHSSKSVVIALNGTNNTAMISCANSVKSSLKAMNKTATVITMRGISCNNGYPLETVDKCMARYASNSTPVIIFTNTPTISVSAYSYYGSVLSVSGDQQFMSTCIPSIMIR